MVFKNINFLFIIIIINVGDYSTGHIVGVTLDWRTNEWQTDAVGFTYASDCGNDFTSFEILRKLRMTELLYGFEITSFPQEELVYWFIVDPT